MRYKIICENEYPAIEVTLDEGQSVKLESGAMLSMTNGIKLEGKRNGSLLGALGKSMFGGEGFFMTTARSNGSEEKIILAPKGIGSIRRIELDGTTNWYLEDGMFLASDDSVSYNMIRQKGVANPLIAGTGGFFILKTEGSGDLFVEAFGSIIELEVTPDNPITVDNNHVIGWEETVHHQITAASGVFGFKTGEGLAIKLSGNGKVLIQTRQPQALAGILSPFIPSGSSGA